MIGNPDLKWLGLAWFGGGAGWGGGGEAAVCHLGCCYTGFTVREALLLDRLGC